MGRHGSCTEGGIYLLRCHVLRSNSKSAQAVPLEKSQFRAEELEDVLPEYKIAAGVYAPNDEIYGKFHVLLPVNEKTKRTLFELKQI